MAIANVSIKIKTVIIHGSFTVSMSTRRSKATGFRQEAKCMSTNDLGGALDIFTLRPFVLRGGAGLR